MGLRGVGVSNLSERVLWFIFSGQISHPLLMGPERKEMWIMEWNVIFEGWGIGHWRGSGYGKDLGGRTHLTIHCSIFFGLSFHDDNMCKWKRIKALGVGATLLDLHIFGGDIKAKKKQGCAPGSLVCLLHLIKKKKKSIPYIRPASDGLSQESVETHRAHLTSSVMDHPLMCISRFPRS